MVTLTDLHFTSSYVCWFVFTQNTVVFLNDMVFGGCETAADNLFTYASLLPAVVSSHLVGKNYEKSITDIF